MTHHISAFRPLHIITHHISVPPLSPIIYLNSTPRHHPSHVCNPSITNHHISAIHPTPSPITYLQSTPRHHPSRIGCARALCAVIESQCTPAAPADIWPAAASSVMFYSASSEPPGPATRIFTPHVPDVAWRRRPSGGGTAAAGLLRHRYVQWRATGVQLQVCTIGLKIRVPAACS